MYFFKKLRTFLRSPESRSSSEALALNFRAQNHIAYATVEADFGKTFLLNASEDIRGVRHFFDSNRPKNRWFFAKNEKKS